MGEKKFKIILFFFVFLLLVSIFLTSGRNSAWMASDDLNSNYTVTLESPISETDPVNLIGRGIKIFLGIIGAIALIMFIYGGLVWMTSGGSSTAIKKGRDTLVWASIGILVIFSSYAILSFIFKAIGAK